MDIVICDVGGKIGDIPDSAAFFKIILEELMNETLEKNLIPGFGIRFFYYNLSYIKKVKVSFGENKYYTLVDRFPEKIIIFFNQNKNRSYLLYIIEGT